MKQPTKAIICAAGLGTRFLPQTKAMPKEMLPIIDKPVIQLIVEQAVAAGVTDIIIVTGSTKRAIEDHFDRSVELENDLRENGKSERADKIKSIAEMANFIYIRQKGFPKGNALPIFNAQHLIDDDEPFFVFFPDDFFRSEEAWPLQLKRAFEKTGKSVISLIEVDKKDSDKYGMVELGDNVDEKVFKLKGLVEKPGPEKTPSSLASVGSYLLTPDIFYYINQKKTGVGGEMVLADSLNEMAREKDNVYGCVIDGVWHDTGDPLKYLKAVVDIALESEKYGAEFDNYIRERIGVK